MFDLPDTARLEKAAALRPWLRWVWRLTGAALATTCVGLAVLLAKDKHLLGGYGAGTTFVLGVVFLSAPTLMALSAALGVIGFTGRLRAGPRHGFGWAILGGLVLFPFAGAATLLGFAMASAGAIRG